MSCGEGDSLVVSFCIHLSPALWALAMVACFRNPVVWSASSPMPGHGHKTGGCLLSFSKSAGAWNTWQPGASSLLAHWLPYLPVSIRSLFPPLSSSGPGDAPAPICTVHGLLHVCPVCLAFPGNGWGGDVVYLLLRSWK